MCNVQCIEFARSALGDIDVAGRDVLEVGSYDVNGSVRRIVEAHNPLSYMGVDIEPGPGVDEIVQVERLISRFGASSFDVVICTEMMEHVLDWRTAVFNLKSVLREGGVLILTTRSRGFHFHGYPGDFWRYELGDMRVIFADMDLETLESDIAESPGVFLKARRTGPILTSEDLGGLALYSIIRRRRLLTAKAVDERAAAVLTKGKALATEALPGPVKTFARAVVNAISSRNFAS